MEHYIRIENKDQKVWVLPCKNLKVALCLYQPSSPKGKALKWLLPVLVKFPAVFEVRLKKLGIQTQKEGMPEALRKYLSKVYVDAADIQFAAFLGTPGIHQKMTIQVSDGGRILGYCKVTENKEIYSIFQHEQMILQYLREHGIEDIPKCIRCGAFGEGKYLFVQTTVKSLTSRVHHELGTLELDFIHRLAECTEVDVAFNQTDFFRSIQKLEEKMDILKDCGFEVRSLERACRNVNAYYQSQTSFSACHRDFTPWNSFVENGKLFVFDFEYAALQYPANMDAIHFLCQTAIFEKNLTALEVLALFRKECLSGALKDLFECPEIALQAYLVDMISLYLSREGNVLKDLGTIKLLRIWIELCSYSV